MDRYLSLYSGILGILDFFAAYFNLQQSDFSAIEEVPNFV